MAAAISFQCMAVASHPDRIRPSNLFSCAGRCHVTEQFTCALPWILVLSIDAPHELSCAQRRKQHDHAREAGLNPIRPQLMVRIRVAQLIAIDNLTNCLRIAAIVTETAYRQTATAVGHVRPLQAYLVCR